MADEAKTADAVDPQQTVLTDTEELKDTSAESIKSLQRELQRTRNRLTVAEQQSGRLDGMQTAIDALVHTLSNQEMDDASKQTLGAVQQLRRSQSATDGQRAEITQTIHGIIQSVGVQSWDDPRVADVVEAFEEGDLVEALSLAKQVRRQARAKSQEDTVVKKDTTKDFDTRVKAEVERQLKEAGVREVDKTKVAGGTNAPPPTVTELLAKNVGKMTRAEMAAHSKALLEAKKG